MRGAAAWRVAVMIERDDSIPVRVARGLDLPQVWSTGAVYAELIKVPCCQARCRVARVISHDQPSDEQASWVSLVRSLQSGPGRSQLSGVRPLLPRGENIVARNARAGNDHNRIADDGRVFGVRGRLRNPDHGRGDPPPGPRRARARAGTWWGPATGRYSMGGLSGPSSREARLRPSWASRWIT